MFYVIRYSIIAFFIICYIFLVIKGRAYTKKLKTKPQITTKEYVISIFVILGIVVFCFAMFYPFEQSFMTFKTEKDAFNYLMIDCSDFERFETDDAIFYIEREIHKSKIPTGNYVEKNLYSLNKKDGKYGFVNYATQETNYSTKMWGDIDCFDESIPPNKINKLKHSGNIMIETEVIYNKPADVSFYSIELSHLENPNDHTATLNNAPLTFCSVIDKQWWNSTIKANSYYSILEGEPLDSLCIKAENTCFVQRKNVNIKIL